MSQQKYRQFTNDSSKDQFYFSDSNGKHLATPNSKNDNIVQEAQSVFIQDSRYSEMGEVLTKTSPELTQPIKCELNEGGVIPDWLQGSFLRLGPGKFEWGNTAYKHVFDGDCLIHKFQIKNGHVYYSNRFLESDFHKKNAKYNRISTMGFGTWAPPDPCSNIFKRMFLYFIPALKNDNCNVKPINVKDSEIWASTETPWILQLDKDTLKTLRSENTMDSVGIGAQGWLAHPHYDSEGNLYNFSVKQKPTCRYDVIKIPMRPGSTEKEPFKGAEIVASIPTSQSLSAYYHSFGMTDNYFILFENPFYIKSVFAVMTMNIFKKSFLDILKWKPEYGTLIRVIDRKTGKEMRRIKVNPVFVFHHVNAYEENGDIIVDVAAYPDASIVSALYLKQLREGHKGEWVKLPNLYRYRLPIAQLQDTTADVLDLPTDKTGRDYECIAADFEMPTINYEMCNGKPYRYTYGVDTPFGHFISKVDVQNKTKVNWYPGEHYSVSEGYFIAKPGAKLEDDGVVVSSVTGVKGKPSFLVILDARTFSEIARATLPFAPALTIHGNFVQG
ncbi:beta,beta-carotene 15,15'-dioxygenase-like [Clytia hemisphaerica]|uniref:Uncharacterized protein n=1 Tax=Clytia hemisphaerica TaxID=252671 RepID=A0A7M5X4G6_9CNID